MAVRSWSSTVIGIQMEATNKYNNESNKNKKKNMCSNSNGVPFPHLYLNKLSSWLVKTESNVKKERRKKPDPPCLLCKGTGRLDCHDCSGQGRTNHVHLTMLPKGEWPKWCRTCGGSGLSYCSRCLGTGEYRYKMGFRFMQMDSDDAMDC